MLWIHVYMYASGIIQGKALADDELKDMVGEAEETSYNLGELPTTDES